MRVKLLPSQVPSYWPLIQRALAMALPPITYESPERENNILSALLKGDMDAWLVYKPGETGIRPEIVALTTVTFDAPSQVRNLEIYCVASLSMSGIIDAEEWRAGLDMLRRHAIAKGCTRIIAWTREARVVEIVKSLGGKADYTFLTFEV